MDVWVAEERVRLARSQAVADGEWLWERPEDNDED